MASLAKHNINSLRLQRNEKSVLDKVEDMDVDNQSDQEGVYLEKVAGTSSSTSESNTSTLIRGKSTRNNKGNKNCIVRQKQVTRITDETQKNMLIQVQFNAISSN